MWVWFAAGPAGGPTADSSLPVLSVLCCALKYCTSCKAVVVMWDRCAAYWGPAWRCHSLWSDIATKQMKKSCWAGPFIVDVFVCVWGGVVCVRGKERERKASRTTVMQNVNVFYGLPLFHSLPKSKDWCCFSSLSHWWIMLSYVCKRPTPNVTVWRAKTKYLVPFCCFFTQTTLYSPALQPWSLRKALQTYDNSSMREIVHSWNGARLK